MPPQDGGGKSANGPKQLRNDWLSIQSSGVNRPDPAVALRFAKRRRLAKVSCCRRSGVSLDRKYPDQIRLGQSIDEINYIYRNHGKFLNTRFDRQRRIPLRENYSYRQRSILLHHIDSQYLGY